MKKIHSLKILRDRRRALRSQATIQERILWRYLKNSNLGFRFQRQHSIGPYIADFYCPKKKMIIEVDGSQHGNKEDIQYDKDRTIYFGALDIQVLRFWNNEISTSIDGVILQIQEFLNPSQPPL